MSPNFEKFIDNLNKNIINKDQTDNTLSVWQDEEEQVEPRVNNHAVIT